MSWMLLEYDYLLCVLQALDSFKAESEFELTLSAGDIVIVRKVIYVFTTIVCLIFLCIVNNVLALFLLMFASVPVMSIYDHSVCHANCFKLIRTNDHI